MGGDDVDVRLERVTKAFNEVKAVDDLDLDIQRGEFFSMLGPSGCGKTTTLRMIGGFEEPSAGTVYLNGEDVTGLPPYKRDVNTVFQSYALFPHLDVYENVAFGLRRKKVDRGAVNERVMESLRLVDLPGFEKRKPSQLSGGQQQRVALARALVNHPQVLLLDEPLGALDLKLRQEMQTELKRIQRAVSEVGITFVYVTHDQEEALTMSDRLAVFNEGRIEQIGTPEAVYERPDNAFVAGFVGASNVLHRGGRVFTVRPEKIRMTIDGGARRDDGNAATGRVRDVVYAGMFTRYIVDLDDGGELVVVKQNLETSSTDALDQRGHRVLLEWSPEHAIETREGA